jgi:hypothetical protein
MIRTGRKEAPVWVGGEKRALDRGYSAILLDVSTLALSLFCRQIISQGLECH